LRVVLVVHLGSDSVPSPCVAESSILNTPKNIENLISLSNLSTDDFYVVKELVEQMNKKSILEKYPEIKQGSNGRFRCNFYDESGKRIQIARSTREAVEQALIEYDAGNVKHSIEECFKTWLDRKSGLTGASKEKYEQCFKRCIFHHGIYKLYIEDVKYVHIESLLRDNQSELTKKYFNNLCTILNGIFNTAEDIFEVNVINIKQSIEKARRVLGDNFKDSLKVTSSIDDTDSVFTAKEERQIIDKCVENDSLVDLGIALLFFTGLREGELAVLRKKNVSKDFTQIYIEHSESREYNQYIEGLPKWKKTRTVLIPEEGRYILKRILELSDKNSEFVFSEVGYSYKWYRTKKFCDRLKRLQIQLCYGSLSAGVNEPREMDYKKSLKSPHDIRRTYDTKLLNGGVPLSVRYSLMGHSTKGIDSHYIRDNFTINEKLDMLENVFDSEYMYQDVPA